MKAQWTLADVWRAILQSWQVLVGMVVIFVLIAVGSFFAYPQTYTATAEQTVEPINVLPTGSSFSTVNMETERYVATSVSVLERAAEQIGNVSIAELKDAVTVEVPRGSQLLIIDVTTGDGVQSAEWANALAEAYREQRVANARAIVDETSEDLTAAIEELEILAEARPAGPARQTIRLQQQTLLDQQATLTMAALFSGSLISQAEVPEDSDRPSILIFLVAGLFIGLLLGALGALMVTRKRRPAPDDRSTVELDETREGQLD